MDVAGLILNHGLYGTVYVVCVISGLVPAVNAEIFLLLVMAAVPEAPALPVALVATCGQMTAKSLMYLTGLGLIRLPLRRYEARLASVHEQMVRRKGGVFALLLFSATSGIPPFYLMSIASGMLQVPFPSFFVAGFAGRFVRFSLFAAFPEVLRRMAP